MEQSIEQDRRDVLTLELIIGEVAFLNNAGEVIDSEGHYWDPTLAELEAYFTKEELDEIYESWTIIDG